MGTKGYKTIRAINRLAAARLNIIAPGKHADGGVLWLHKRKDGGAQWVLRVTVHRRRREMVEHPFGTIKARMGATHFLMKRLKNVKTKMSLAVLAYNLTRVMNIIGVGPLPAAMR